MKQTLYIIFGLIFLTGCQVTGEKNRNDINSDLESFATIDKPQSDTLTLLADNFVDKQIMDTIRDRRLGVIFIGQSIKSALESLDSEVSWIFDSIPNYEITENEYEYECKYKIYNSDRELLYILYVEEYSETPKTITRIEIRSNCFVTETGLKIGDRVSDLQRTGKIKKADFTYETGLIVRIENFKGAFSLDYNHPEFQFYDYENPIPEEIPENLIINAIYLL